MITIFWYSAFGAIALLILATGVLVWLNWGEQIYMRLLSGLFVGTVTFLIAFVSTLKPADERVSFATSVVENTRNHLPMFSIPEGAGSPISWRACEAGRLAQSLFNTEKDGVVEWSNKGSISEDDVTRFNLELLQYHILDRLRHRQATVLAIGQYQTPSGMVAELSVASPPILSDPERLRGDDALDVFKPIRFGATSDERLKWKVAGLVLPKGSQVRLGYDPGGENIGPLSASISIERRGHFTLEINIVPMGATGTGALPKGLQVPPNDDRSHYRTHSYHVSARATFTRLTAGNHSTEENKAWIQWVFRELRSYFGN